MTHILSRLVGLCQVMENLNEVLQSAVTALQTPKGGFAMSSTKTEPHHFIHGFEHNFWLEKLIPRYRETPRPAQATHLSPHASLGPGHLAVKMQLWWCPLNKGGYYTQIDPPSLREATDTAVIFATHLTILALRRAIRADRTPLAKPGKMGKMISFVIRCCAARALCNVKRNCC